MKTAWVIRDKESLKYYTKTEIDSDIYENVAVDISFSPHSSMIFRSRIEAESLIEDWLRDANDPVENHVFLEGGIKATNLEVVEVVTEQLF